MTQALRIGLPASYTYQAWRRVAPGVCRNIDEFSRVKTYGYDKARFLRESFACHLLNWSQSEQYEWTDAQQRIHHLVEHPEGIAALSSYAIDVADDPQILGTLGKFGRTDYVQDIRGHLYVNLSGWREVPEEFWADFADPGSSWPFRAELSFFPGGGGEVPDVAGLSTVGEPSMIDEAMGVEGRSERERIRGLVRTYRQRIVEQPELPVDGLIQLGQAQVRASHSGIIANERFVARYALMTTTPWHVLDGPALWLQIHDLATRRVMFCAAGTGRHSQQPVDDLNNHICGLVFGTKLHAFATALKLSASKKLPRDQMVVASVENSLAEELLKSVDEDLASARRFARFLDYGVPFGATARLLMGPTVVTPPSLSGTDKEDKAKE